MTTSIKSILALAVAVVIAAAIYGGYQYPKIKPVLGSATGTTFNTAKIAAVNMNLASPGVNGTTTSILNTDASDRYVSALKMGCEGVGTSQTAYTGAGLAALQLSVGTTSAANPSSRVNSFANVALNMTLSTTTSDLLVSSSTLLLATSSWAAVWPAGSYMSFTFNATNTALCTVGVDYFGS